MSEPTKHLMTRMFTAANIIDEVRIEYAARNGMARPSDSPVSWSAHDLRTFSDRWDREDAEKAAEAAAIEDLARELHLARIVTGVVKGDQGYDELSDFDRKVYRAQARQLNTSGYRKGGA